MNKEKVMMAFMSYMESRGKTHDDFIVGAFLEEVKDYPEEAILKALQKAIFSDDFPGPNVPIKILKEMQPQDDFDYEAYYQWDRYQQELRHRPSENVRFDDPIAAHIAESIIPIKIQKLHLQEKDEHFVQKEFIKTYKEMKRRPDVYLHIKSKGTNLLTNTGRNILESKINETKQLGDGKND